MRLLVIITLGFLIRVAPACAEPLHVGALVPMTGSASLMGESLQGVIKVAHLKNLNVEFEDDKCEGKTALSAYNRLRSRGIRVFYVACSGSILALAPQAKRNGDLILTSYAGSARIRETGPEVLRFNPDAVSIAEKLALLITPELKPTVVLFEEQDYAQSLADKLQELLGDAIAHRISYRSDASSFAPEVLKVKQAGVASVFMIPVGDAAAQRILRQLSLTRVTVPIIGEVNLCDFPFRPSDFGLHGLCVSARFSGSRFEQFIKDYKAQVGRAPAYPFYDAIALDVLLHLDVLAVRYKDPEPLRAKLLEGFVGVFAKYSLSDDGEVIRGADYLETIRF